MYRCRTIQPWVGEGGMVHPLLVVDNDPTQLSGLIRFLTDQFGYQVTGVTSGREAVDYFLLKRSPQPELVIVNHSMMDMNASDLVRMIRRSQRRLPIIMLAPPQSGNLMAEALAAGVDDVLIKPVLGELLKQTVWNLLQRNMLSREVERLTRLRHAKVSFADMESRAESMRVPLTRAKQATNSRIPVLISGASGVGKEYLAQAIHGSSERAGKLMVTINCEMMRYGRVSEQQLAQEFHDARGGTLLLTHIDAAPADAQQVILSQLKAQKKESFLGSACHDVRVITTASPAFKHRYESCEFNDELYFWLTAFPIQLPTLSERMDDIPHLCDRFLSRLSLEYRDKMVRLSPSAKEMIMDYPWPGNIRELQMVLAKTLIYSVSDVIEPADLALALTQQARNDHGSPHIPAEWEHLARSHPQQVYPFSLTQNDGNIRTMNELEAEVIRHAIRYYKGHMSEVARRLGIGRSTLYRKIQDYNLEEVA